MNSSTSILGWRAVAAFAMVATSARAQCAPQWLPGDGWPGVNGAVTKMATWDPDGAGPATPKVVVGGTFTIAGPTAATNLAAYDPATGTWSAFGSGVPDVQAIVGLPNGALVVGGAFSTAGGVAANNLAVWHNGVWSQLGGGTNGPVSSLALMPNGDLIVGGTFWSAGGVAINHLARWNGTTWSMVGPGLSADGFIWCLAARADGTLFVGGGLVVPGIQGHFIGQWDGTTWTALSLQPVFPKALAILPNGDLLMGGQFANLGSPNVTNLARWDGSAWSVLGGWFSDPVVGLTVLPNGDVLAMGSGTIFTGTLPLMVAGVARWNGSTWTPIPGFGARVAVELPGGDLLGGSTGTPYVKRWNGTAWSPVATGFESPVWAIAALPGADWFAGGSGAAIGTGTTWAAAGSGVPGGIRAALHLPNGDIVVGGDPSFFGGLQYSPVSRWNGATWQLVGAGLSGTVRALARLPGGDIVAGGSGLSSNGVPIGTCARWNGTTWSPLGGGTQGDVMQLGVLPNGHLVAAGYLGSAGGQPVVGIAKWDGATWSSVGTGVPEINAMAILPNGHLVVSTPWTGPSQMKLWNGAYWWNLGGPSNAPIDTLAAVHDGAILAGGRFTSIGGVPAQHLARWDGVTWSPIGAGVDNRVRAIAVKPSGEIAVGGDFLFANGAVSPHFARLQLPCAPAAVDAGAGCASSGGANVLAVESPAWLGSTFRARGTGLPALALVSVITGFTPISVPLASFFPQAGAGCNLLVSPDLLWLQVAQNGEVTTSIPLPSTPSLVGLSFYHQLNPVEVDLALNIVSITATNALQLTTGLY